MKNNTEVGIQNTERRTLNPPAADKLRTSNDAIRDTQNAIRDTHDAIRDTQYAIRDTLNVAPLLACIFLHSIEAEPVCFVEDTKAGKSDNLRIIGYSGQIIPNHWYWGNLVFDLAGLTFAKAKTPVLQEHFTDKRMGFAEKQEITDKVTVEGKFLDNPNAQEIKKDMLGGFPMEASLYVPPSVVEYILEGTSVQVNGQILNGPGTVFRKATIKEVSICVFGADSNTNSAAFTDKNKEISFNILQGDTKMTDVKVEITPLTAETFAAQYPDLQKAIVDAARAAGKSEGIASAKAEFAAFAERFKADPAFCLEQYAAGKGLDEAKDAFIVKLSQAKPEPAKKSVAVVDVATQEFVDNQDKKTSVPAINEEGWKKEYANSAEVQKEFSSAEIYAAYKMAESKGKVRIYEVEATG